LTGGCAPSGGSNASLIEELTPAGPPCDSLRTQFDSSRDSAPISLGEAIGSGKAEEARWRFLCAVTPPTRETLNLVTF
jgi:hypothetical protein